MADRAGRSNVVSRETRPVTPQRNAAPPPAPSAVAAFAAALPAARRYAGWLAGAGVERGLLGPREVPRLWDRHLVNCADLVPVADGVLGPKAAAGSPLVVDLGSGAGLPGVVVALLRPRWRLVLLEPMQRRVTFLTEVVGALGLSNVTVVRGRAPQACGEVPPADLVLARAVAPMHQLVGWGLPLLAPDGSLLAMKGSSAAEELQQARSAITAAGGVAGEVIAIPHSPTRVVRVTRAAKSSDIRAHAGRS